MFVTKEQVQQMTGYDVTQQVVALAQVMVETYVGKSESEVTDANDLTTLARATAFQSAYLGAGDGSPNLLLEQAAVKSIAANEATTVFDTSLLAPYMAPWAVFACRRLSWFGSRSIRTGPVFDSARPYGTWETV